MKKQLTATDFAHNGQGHYASDLTTYEVYNNTEGNNVLSLVLIATDSDNNSIDCGAGPYATWAELLTEMNAFIALDEATTPAIVATIIRSYGMWQHPIAVEKALCFDGKRRKVRLNQDGRTGRCTIGKKTLKGFISYVGSASCGDKEDYQFVAYSDQNN